MWVTSNMTSFSTGLCIFRFSLARFKKSNLSHSKKWDLVDSFQLVKDNLGESAMEMVTKTTKRVRRTKHLMVCRGFHMNLNMGQRHSRKKGNSVFFPRFASSRLAVSCTGQICALRSLFRMDKQRKLPNISYYNM